MIEQLNILFEDADLMVVNKPSGLITDDAETRKTGEPTLEEQVRSWRATNNLPAIDRSGIVHRLDKETSGVLIIAKNEQALSSLQDLFQKREVKKEYVALATGIIVEEEFSVDAPIGRNPRVPLKYCVLENGRPALTDFIKIKELKIDNSLYTLLKVYPQTGRTHQIRVHITAYGHPLAADSIYEGAMRYSQDIRLFNRLMLHAHAIEFKLPDKKPIKVEAPYPEVFASL